MFGLRHPNCVSLVGICKEPFCVLTEFCPFGDLFSYIESRKKRNLPFPFPYILDVLLDVSRGIYWILIFFFFFVFYIFY